eukprot:scaffold72632_cov33-Phaeocystis_antarctica.AAC.1
MRNRRPPGPPPPPPPLPLRSGVRHAALEGRDLLEERRERFAKKAAEPLPKLPLFLAGPMGSRRTQAGSRPGRPRCATTSDLRQNPRIWRPDIHQGDHTQLEVFPSEMRCRRVLLLASRISVPSPATPCTLFTPNGAPCGLISRICFLSFAGANGMPPDGDALAFKLVPTTAVLLSCSLSAKLK